MALVHQNYNQSLRKKRKYQETYPDLNQHLEQNLEQNLDPDIQTIQYLRQTVDHLQYQNKILLTKLDKLINMVDMINIVDVTNKTDTKSINVSTQTDEIFYNYDYYA